MEFTNGSQIHVLAFGLFGPFSCFEYQGHGALQRRLTKTLGGLGLEGLHAGQETELAAITTRFLDEFKRSKKYAFREKRK